MTVKVLGKNHWQIRYHDPASGKDVRRRLSGLSQSEARGVAGSINHELLAKGGFVPGKAAAPTIAEGLAEAIRLANTLPETERERAWRASKFVKWLAEHYPGVQTWDQLRPAMVQAYAVERERGEKAFDTVRLDLAPVKLTWRYMAENYPDQVRSPTRIKLKAQPKQEIECLEPLEVAALLDWLRGKASDLWSMACLQGLAGLRPSEAAAIRLQDVDFARQTVEVTDTGNHRPKNRNSYRVIPVCGEVAAVLKTAVANQGVRPATGELFTNGWGNLWERTTLGHQWTRTLRWAARELNRPR